MSPTTTKTSAPTLPTGRHRRPLRLQARTGAAVWSSLLAVLTLASSACQQSAPDEQPAAPQVAVAPDAMPVPGRYLDRASPANAGVLVGGAPDGTPTLTGVETDLRVTEARRFYDTIQYPDPEPQAVDYPDPFTGQVQPSRLTAPLTLEKWKAVFGFSPRRPDETLEAYRQRTGSVVYYNKNELGLGRELGCAEFDDGLGADGAPLVGVACFVSNFGVGFNDPHRGLDLAAQGSDPRNTVCITFRPSLPPGYEVQFYTFGGDGRRQDWAQLDTLGARPHPHVCMNCHGGAYDSSKHLARNARFLPLDPNLVLFADGPQARPSLTRAAQEEPIRAMNALALRTPLTDAQREMLHELYAGQVETPGAVSRPTWTPQGWKGSAQEADLYDKVVKPYCATCHLAITSDRGPGARKGEQKGGGNKKDEGGSPWGSMFQSLEGLRRVPMQAVVCGSFSMPNAQPTLAHFWDAAAGPVTIGGRTHHSAADAFLDVYGLDRQSCHGLASMGSCNRGDDPDSLCGNASSGAACNLETGRCVSTVARLATAPQASGVCRTDGSRGCPKSSTCEAAPPMSGLPTFDGICLAD